MLTSIRKIVRIDSNPYTTFNQKLVAISLSEGILPTDSRTTYTLSQPHVYRSSCPMQSDEEGRAPLRGGQMKCRGGVGGSRMN